jgi:hypothetical protein
MHTPLQSEKSRPQLHWLFTQASSGLHAIPQPPQLSSLSTMQLPLQ